jgi:hypothetical protein
MSATVWQVDPGFVYELGIIIDQNGVEVTVPVGHLFRSNDGLLECWSLNSAWKALKPGGKPDDANTWLLKKLAILPIASSSTGNGNPFPSGPNLANSFFGHYPPGKDGLKFKHAVELVP